MRRGGRGGAGAGRGRARARAPTHARPPTHSTCTAAFAAAVLDGSVPAGVWRPEALPAATRAAVLARAAVGARRCAVGVPAWEADSEPKRLGFGMYWCGGGGVQAGGQGALSLAAPKAHSRSHGAPPPLPRARPA